MNFTCEQIIARRKELWEANHNIVEDKKYIDSVADYIIKSPHIHGEIKNHPEHLIEMVFCIVDKDQNTVPFFMNQVQADFIRDLNKAIEDYKAGKRLHLNFLILKSRQQGFTTVITAYQLSCAITKKNFSGITIADVNVNSSTIFEKKAKYPFSKLPEPIKPTQKFNNRRELMFDKLNSSWVVDTAGNKQVGRSNTLNFLHGSEGAFWDSISAILTGLGEALTKNSIKILESTANGYNEFKDLWDGAPKNTWEALFYYWFDTPEYESNFPNEDARDDFHTAIDQIKADSESEREVLTKLNKLLPMLIDKFGYDAAWKKIYWYYQKWSGYIDKEMVKQEYPCNPREAFLATGRCVFDQEIVNNRIEELTKVYENRVLNKGWFEFEWNDPDTKDKIKDETIKWLPNRNGYITIYDDKRKGLPYVIGGDTKGEGSDLFGGTVINNVTGNRVAYLHANLDPDTYTHQMYCMGKYYNYALMGIEINFDIYPVKELERLNYHHQYFRQSFDSFMNVPQKKYGFKTDGNSRQKIISQQIEMIRDHIDLFPDIEMLNECITFVYDDKVRPDAQSGKHDDLLFSDMIANEIRGQQVYTMDAERVGLPNDLPKDLLRDLQDDPEALAHWMKENMG